MAQPQKTIRAAQQQGCKFLEVGLRMQRRAYVARWGTYLQRRDIYLQSRDIYLQNRDTCLHKGMQICRKGKIICACVRALMGGNFVLLFPLAYSTPLPTGMIPVGLGSPNCQTLGRSSSE